MFFVPAAWLISLAVLNMLRQGRVKWYEWIAGLVIHVLVLSVLAVAALTDGQPLLAGTKEMRTAEMISAVLYLAMQTYYCSLDAW